MTSVYKQRVYDFLLQATPDYHVPKSFLTLPSFFFTCSYLLWWGNTAIDISVLFYAYSVYLSFLQTLETREILHFHYTTWPDFGVPESPASFLNFLFKVRESGCLNSDQGPVVVHCSAGIGRSGTFCLVDTCLLLVSTALGISFEMSNFIPPTSRNCANVLLSCADTHFQWLYEESWLHVK